MQTDLELFSEYEKNPIHSTLRIYSWRPKCISLGYSQKIKGEIDLEKAAALGWDIVQRPTGGGIVFHNEAEVTYSLIIGKDRLPDGLVPSYIKISEAAILSLARLGVKAEIGKQKAPASRGGKRTAGLCFSCPAEYEITYQGLKIVGAAQKRGKKALLQQGSIFVRANNPQAFSVLKKDHEKQSAISIEEVLGREVGFEELSRALIEGFKEGLNCEF
jgi:lipoate-protein ligase A